jgi:hypothetical protein
MRVNASGVCAVRVQQRTVPRSAGESPRVFSFSILYGIYSHSDSQSAVDMGRTINNEFSQS